MNQVIFKMGKPKVNTQPLNLILVVCEYAYGVYGSSMTVNYK